jgi:mannose-6-phosphate isomerase-like protein (cupin superfamily)
MITLLESGSANASIATLDKLARALTVGFPTLVAPPTLALSEPAATTQLTAIWEDDLGSMAQLLLAGGRDRLVDLWQWRLMPKSFYCATPDPSGSEEFVLSLSGTLTVVVESDTLVVKEGQLVRFASDVAYSYENRGVEPVEFIRAVLVPR